MAKVDTHPAGAWPIIDLREGQCRFACTSDEASPDRHLFCGQPIAWLKGKPTNLCGQHLAVVSALPVSAAERAIGIGRRLPAALLSPVKHVAGAAPSTAQRRPHASATRGAA